MFMFSRDLFDKCNQQGYWNVKTKNQEKANINICHMNINIADVRDANFQNIKQECNINSKDEPLPTPDSHPQPNPTLETLPLFLLVLLVLICAVFAIGRAYFRRRAAPVSVLTPAADSVPTPANSVSTSAGTS